MKSGCVSLDLGSALLSVTGPIEVDHGVEVLPAIPFSANDCILEILLVLICMFSHDIMEPYGPLSNFILGGLQFECSSAVYT